MSTDCRTRAWIEVQAASLRRNLGRIRSAAGPMAPVIPMVKADAYGLGALDAVDALRGEDPWGFGVATVSEGRALREHGVPGRIVVFGPLPPGEVADAVELDLSPTLSSLSGLERLDEAATRAGRRIAFHAEVDTGMGRAGFAAGDVALWGPALHTAHGGSALRWEGCFTHFHSADEPGGPGMDQQVAAFEQVLRELAPPACCVLHATNSAAALRLRSSAPWVTSRPGIYLYGGAAAPDLPAPDPVAAVRARVVLVREVVGGATVGYGATHRAAGPERWATLAIGYGDGLPLGLGNRGYALIGGQRAPLIGRVSMDLTVANISGLGGVEAGDIATLLGCDGEAEILLDEVAELAGTISYDVLTGLTARLPRCWIDDDGA